MCNSAIIEETIWVSFCVEDETSGAEPPQESLQNSYSIPLILIISVYSPRGMPSTAFPSAFQLSAISSEYLIRSCAQSCCSLFIVEDNDLVYFFQNIKRRQNKNLKWKNEGKRKKGSRKQHCNIPRNMILTILEKQQFISNTFLD